MPWRPRPSPARPLVGDLAPKLPARELGRKRRCELARYKYDMRVERSLRGTTVSLPAEGLGYNRGVEAVSLCDVYYVMRMSVR